MDEPRASAADPDVEAVLGSRYELLRPLGEGSDRSRSWLGVGGYDIDYLVKLWPYDGDDPDDVQRALWDAELRTLYRLGSSPGADESLLILRDAGIDRESHCFVMVLHAPGFTSLADGLGTRSRYPWLSNESPRARRDLWHALGELARGLRLLHEQEVIHRDVAAENVYFDEHEGLSSLRLGGFEWSVRLGVPITSDPPSTWSSPPELLAGEHYGYRLESDWFGFGMLAARCLLDLENYRNNPPVERYARTLAAVPKATRALSERERDLIVRLIARDPRDRLTREEEIRQRITEIVAGLDAGFPIDDETRPFVLIVNPYSQGLANDLSASGFRPDVNDPTKEFNPHDPEHVALLTRFLQADLITPQLHAVGDPPSYFLVGERVTVRIRAHEFTERATRTRVATWNAAFCIGVAELRARDGMSASFDLPPGRLAVHTTKTLGRDAVLQGAQDWAPVLPAIDRAARLRAGLARFHHLVRCLNQIELLMRDAELFAFKVVDRPEGRVGFESVVIEEIDRERQPVDFIRMAGGLAEFLQQELESAKPGCNQVILSELDQDSLSLEWVPEPHQWKVMEVDVSGRVALQRAISAELSGPAPDFGILRTYGMFGQVSLVRRRKRAIDRLESHSYLLRSLSAPGQVYMDTGASRPAVDLRPDIVDEPKRRAIEHILRVRPIFALQGPPGTGKTTLVAWLIREILADDPVGQILVTAQAHGAVDVLREMVRREAFAGVPEHDQPLAVRLGGTRQPVDDDMTTLIPAMDEASVEGVSLRVLELARDALPPQGERTALQAEWWAAADEMAQALRTASTEAGVPDFCELVKRGAHITYCTTSAGELEELAEMTQSFDWSILEEAGKAHSFDLALPLQAGHRWLLIGDHHQLPPYRFDHYQRAIENLEATVAALRGLPSGGAGLVDYEWIRTWEYSDDEAKSEFTQYLRAWLNTFARIFDQCDSVIPADGTEATDGVSTAPAAGMLTGQHRMHPTIGELISEAYYRGKLDNETVDREGRPLPRVCHPFVAPAGIANKAIVWLDLPWAALGGEEEQGPSTGRPRYTNPAEVDAIGQFLAQLGREGDEPLDLAILSPYNRQVGLINQRLRFKPSAGLRLKQIRRRRGGEDTARLGHTVDSFQGNQAEVIAVSLVRNNTLPPGDGLGFLREAPRVNVLLSRAERLLVLVGSFEFFQEQVRLVSLDNTFDPLWHWKKVVSMLELWFEEGSALRLSAANLSASTGP